MSGFSIRFSDEEQALIREAAEGAGVSLEAFVRAAAVAAASNRKHLRDGLLDDIFDASAELNERLA